MNPDSPYFQAHAGLQRIRDELIRHLVTATETTEVEQLHVQLARVHAALERVTTLAARHDPDPMPVLPATVGTTPFRVRTGPPGDNGAHANSEPIR